MIMNEMIMNENKNEQIEIYVLKICLRKSID